MRLLAAVMLVVLVVLAACAGGDDDERLVVFAAASLTDAFDRLAVEFERANPDVDVIVNAAGSSELASQIIERAPADVFASADVVSMDRVVDAGLAAGEPRIFASNQLEILVETGNPLGIGGVADLADPGLVVVGCSPEVPCGRYADEVFDNAGVDVTPDSYEINVRSVVTKVVTGEADAGVVYVSDVLAVRDDADGVPIADDINVVADYPIVPLTDATNPTLAAEFVEFVDDDRGRVSLDAAGFSTT